LILTQQNSLNQSFLEISLNSFIQQFVVAAERGRETLRPRRPGEGGDIDVGERPQRRRERRKPSQQQGAGPRQGQGRVREA